MTKKKTTRYIVELPSALEDTLKHNSAFIMSDVERAREQLRDTQQKLNGSVPINREMTLSEARKQLAETLAHKPIPNDTEDEPTEDEPAIKMSSAPSSLKDAKLALRKTQRSFKERRA